MNNRIQNNPGLQYAATRSLNDKASASAAGHTAGPAPAHSDKLSLSPQADRLSQLTQIAQQSPDINQSRVDSLRQAVADGSYQVNADSLASNMLGVENKLNNSR